MIDAQGFNRNLRGDFNEQAKVSNAAQALRLLRIPLSVATTAQGKRIYFLGSNPLTANERRNLTTQILSAFCLSVSVRSLDDAIRQYAPAATTEFLAGWQDKSRAASLAKNAAKARDERLARDPSLAERRAKREKRMEDAAERMSAARRAPKSYPKPPAIVHREAPAISRVEWLTGLEWDQRNRIQNLLATNAGASPDHSLVFARWIVGAAARTLRPGARSFTIAFRGVAEAESIAALEALAAPWLGLGLSPDTQPSQLRSQVTDRLVIHALTRDRREEGVFALHAARVKDFIGDEERPIERTFALACQLADDEPLPEGFLEVRVKGFDPGALRNARDQIFAEAKECALAAMSKTNPNMRVRERMNAYRASLYE